MSDYKGDYAEDATVTMTFNTFDSDGKSITVTDLATTDVFIYKDGVVLADPDAGVTLTLNAGTGDGAHIVKVDMNADAQYVTGADYEAKFEGITIDTQTPINIFVGEWSCQNRFMRGTDSAALATTLNTKVPNNLNTTASGNIGIDWANVENPTTALDLSATDIRLVDTASIVTGGATSTELDKVPKSDGTSSWNTTALAAIESEANDALVALNLDKLMAVSTGIAADNDLSSVVVNQSILAHIMSKTAAVATAYNASDDSLDAQGINMFNIEAKIDAAQTDLDTITDTGVNTVSLSANAITAAVIATDAIDADALAADAVNLILDDEVDNDGSAISLRQAQKLMLSILTAKSSGGGTATLVFRDINDSKNRLSVTVDANGNRTAVGTRDAT